MEEITQLLWNAAQEKKACRISLQGEPLSRVVHPYGICCTSANRIVLVCWQAMGFTKAGGKEGYRNLLLDDILEAEMMETGFRVQPDFNPRDSQYKEWVFHV